MRSTTLVPLLVPGALESTKASATGLKVSKGPVVAEAVAVAVGVTGVGVEVATAGPVRQAKPS